VQLGELLGSGAVGLDADSSQAGHGFAFCGLGNPLNFFRQLEKEGVELVGRKTFADHHFYTSRDIAEIEKRARAAGSEYLITTVKDAVRMTGMNIEMPCYVAEIETVMDDPEAFRELIVS
jgi:tetraacyldisaccharide 4'-kinase